MMCFHHHYSCSQLLALWCVYPPQGAFLPETEVLSDSLFNWQAHHWHLCNVTAQLLVVLLAGFIVDKTRGIICTNRHVVTPGAQQEVWQSLAAAQLDRQMSQSSKLTTGEWDEFMKCIPWCCCWHWTWQESSGALTSNLAAAV
jgi:hypothetical protein